MHAGRGAIARPDLRGAGRTPGGPAGFRRSYTAVLYVMPAVLLVVVLLDPAEYAGLASLVPPAYRGVMPGLLRLDEMVTLSVAVLSLLAAVQRTRRAGDARRWTTVASYAFLAAPSLVGLIPFGYWFFRVRKRERAGRWSQENPDGGYGARDRG